MCPDQCARPSPPACPPNLFPNSRCTARYKYQPCAIPDIVRKSAEFVVSEPRAPAMHKSTQLVPLQKESDSSLEPPIQESILSHFETRVSIHSIRCGAWQQRYAVSQQVRPLLPLQFSMDAIFPSGP